MAESQEHGERQARGDWFLALAARTRLSPPYLGFALLRLLVIAGCYLWLFLTPLSPTHGPHLALAIDLFTFYCVALYTLVWVWPGPVMKWNVVVLSLDLLFAWVIVGNSGGLASPFTHGFYLLAALHAFYYGLRRGIGVCAASSILFVVAMWPTIERGELATAGIRVGFLWLLGVSLGLLSQRERRRRLAVAELNRELEEERRKLERAYRHEQELQEHLKNVLESISDGIIVVNSAGVVTTWNRAMETRYGIPAGEVVGRPLMEAFPNLREEGLWEPIAAVIRREADHFERREFRHKTLRRGEVIVNVRGYPLQDPQGRVLGAVIVNEDVTARAKMERQLRQSEKLAALGTLAAGVAHEINNPIGIVTSRAELMMMEGEERPLPPEALEDLRVIAKHAQRVARIARGLLSFSRQAAWELVPVDMNRLVEDVLVLVEKQLIKDGIRLERDLAPGLPPVPGSGNHLEQVLLNLLNNAREAMPHGGILRVATRFRQDGAGGDEPGERVEIQVADSGVGIPEDVLPKIFDPFFTTKDGGTGLGLSISYGIVQDHGGILRVESQAGRGTTFSVVLPTETLVNAKRGQDA